MEYNSEEFSKVIQYPNYMSIKDIKEYLLGMNIYSRKNPNYIQITTSKIPYEPNKLLCDLKIKNPEDEDNLLKNEPYLYYNMRRGLSFIYDGLDIDNYYLPLEEAKKSRDRVEHVARKGLHKFFDLHPGSLKDLLNYNDMDKSMNYVWMPIQKHIDKKTSIEVILTRKANGENAQISYCSIIESWCIASKNVSLMARNRSDLDSYKSESTTRYTYALEIAEVWFDILERISKSHELNDIKQFFCGRTFIGEYIGGHQHLVKYPTKNILFFAVVNNDSSEDCINPKEAFKMFSDLKLDTVLWKSCGVYSTVEELQTYLKKLYVLISKGKLEVDEEGLVLYFVTKREDAHTIALVKIKTLEYRIYRKIRQFLIKVNNKSIGSFFIIIEADYAFKKFKAEYKTVIDNTLGEVLKIMKNESSPISHTPINYAYYENVANFAFDCSRLQTNSKFAEESKSHYVDFLRILVLYI